ncbi:MAG: DUF2894 domain-containing protein [Haliea sp.]
MSDVCSPLAEERGAPRPVLASAAISGLRRYLQQRRALQPLSPQQQFEAALRAQEQAILGGLATEPATLAATRRFRELRAGQAADRELVALRAALPENPGPLNPQALMIRTLLRLQGISPGYVERFLPYSRSLCWLDRVASRTGGLVESIGLGLD